MVKDDNGSFVSDRGGGRHQTLVRSLFLVAVVVTLFSLMQSVKVSQKSSSMMEMYKNLLERIEYTALESRGINDILDAETETALPPEPKPENTFSACLLIMDDNHRLSEWLAFHYLALSLRYLVVAVDPRSRTSPAAILERWRPYMEIVVWNDKDYAFRPNAKEMNGTTFEKTRIHRNRQRIFFAKCTSHLQGKNRTWTSYHDVDEYLALDADILNDTDHRIQQPGAILKFLREIRANHPQRKLLQGNCLTLPRATYGAIESSKKEIQKGVPSFLNASRFETFRWRYRSRHNEGKVNGQPKSIMDVSKIGHHEKMEVHRTISECPFGYVGERPFSIHHYIGSWEYYIFRDDARARSHEQWWENKANVQSGGSDDEIRPWIQGFVKLMGKNRTQHLLQDVGILEET